MTSALTFGGAGGVCACMSTCKAENPRASVNAAKASDALFIVSS